MRRFGSFLASRKGSFRFAPDGHVLVGGLALLHPEQVGALSKLLVREDRVGWGVRGVRGCWWSRAWILDGRRDSWCIRHVCSYGNRPQHGPASTELVPCLVAAMRTRLQCPQVVVRQTDLLRRAVAGLSIERYSNATAANDWLRRRTMR